MPIVCPPVSLRDVCGLDPATTLVLTVNNRYARRILARLGASLDAGRAVMAVPDILPLGAWLARLADDLSFHHDQPMPAWMADSFGALYLWRRVIDEVEAGHALLDKGQAARLAHEADRLLDEWRIEVRPDEETPDFTRFMLWRDHYRALLKQHDLEDSNLAYERVLAAVAGGVLQPGVTHIVLAGFNEWSPRFSLLLKAVQQQGVALSVLHEPAEPAYDVQRVQAPDPQAEWVLAAQWARRQLVSDPDACYAIVVPGLESNVAQAHRVLHNTLSPHGLAFNIAVGRPLSEWPLVRAALAWLSLVARFARGQSCSAADVGQALLAGGCAGHHTEAGGRATLDARLRHDALLELSPEQIAGLLDVYAPQLARAWQSCMDNVAQFAPHHVPGEWAPRLRRVMESLGFPGQAGLDSHAWQTLEAFDQLLERLVSQSPVAGQISFGQAVGMLKHMAAETLFQPQRDPDARLDVLGFLESEGGSWDGVWVLGLTDEALPAAPRPNPLIPAAALRRVNAPRATPERELQWAQNVFDALLASAPSIWLSHAGREGERELRPSPCVTRFPVQQATPELPDQSPIPLVYVVDDQAPPVQDGERVRGGISLLDAQARNPLWAFVRYRLGARELPDYTDLAAQNVRGMFLHKAMELFWQIVPDHTSLQRLLQEDGLEPLLIEVTERAADETLTEFSPALRELELQRARTVLRRWLDVEGRRHPFVVEGVEQRVQWTHHNIDLRVRLDRVDRLADGRLLVIDYKSGAGVQEPHKSWTRARPIDIQLPFYAAALAGSGPGVAALVLASLHARQVKAAGVSDGDCGFADVAHFTSWAAFDGLSWDEVLQGWRTAIETLVSEFAQGVASNVVFDVNDLRYCEVLPFLRLNEEYLGVDAPTQ